MSQEKKSPVIQYTTTECFTLYNTQPTLRKDYSHLNVPHSDLNVFFLLGSLFVYAIIKSIVYWVYRQKLMFWFFVHCSWNVCSVLIVLN